MTRDECRRVKSFAADALSRIGCERADFVAERCGADDSLRAEVQSLFEATAAAADLYETPLVSTSEMLAIVAATEDASLVGHRIGAYRVVGEIGEGGMGGAFLAERADEAFQKRVVIKLIKRGMDTEAILRRFRHERQILAKLEHPNIAELLVNSHSSS